MTAMYQIPCTFVVDKEMKHIFLQKHYSLTYYLQGRYGLLKTRGIATLPLPLQRPCFTFESSITQSIRIDVKSNIADINKMKICVQQKSRIN